MIRRFRSPLAALLLGLLLTVASGAVGAQAALTAPTIPVAPNTTTPFLGAGFVAGEPVSLWMSAPDGTVAPLNGTIADNQGAISATVSFLTAGIWNVTAHGQTSGVQVIGTYAVGTTSALPATSGLVPGISAAALPGQAITAGSAPLPASFPQVSIGTPVIFSGAGFAANEPLAFWETAPNSTVAPIAATPAPDATGTFTTNITFPTAGFWQVTAHGLTSGREVIGRYMVTDNGTTTTTAPSTLGGVAAPAGTAGSATVGASVTFIASGFASGERVSLWTTAPDGTVTALPQANADTSGTVSVITAFALPGGWQITAHGVDSGHEAVGRYQVTGA